MDFARTFDQVVADISSPGVIQKAAWHSLEGTIQRLNYEKRELTLVANGQQWRFMIRPECQLWFDGRRANLRCFQPLDHVEVVYESHDGRIVVLALYGP